MNMFSESKGMTRLPTPSLADRTGKGLGWFSIALGLTELVGARRLTRVLGIQGRERLVRAFGARELASGATVLAGRPVPGVWSRVAGDALDLAALGYAFSVPGAKKRNVGLALATVGGVAAIDLATGLALSRPARNGGVPPRPYRERSRTRDREQARPAAAGQATASDIVVPAAASAIQADAVQSDNATGPAAEAIHKAL
jgi:hypothetical protein